MLVLVVHYARRDSPALEGAIVKVTDAMLHTLSVAFLFCVLGAVAGAWLGLVAVAKGLLSVLAVGAACYIAGVDMGDDDNGHE